MKTKDGEIIKCDECGAEAVIGYELTDDYGQAQQFAYCATHDDLDDLDYRDKNRLASTWSDEADFDDTDIATLQEEWFRANPDCDALTSEKTDSLIAEWLKAEAISKALDDGNYKRDLRPVSRPTFRDAIFSGMDEWWSGVKAGEIEAERVA